MIEELCAQFGCKTVRRKVLALSAAAADRLLAGRKARCSHRGRGGTMPGSLPKHHIPIRTEHWDIHGPGGLEADSVAPCGETLEGEWPAPSGAALRAKAPPFGCLAPLGSSGA